MKKYFVFGTVAMALILSSISGSAISVAFPEIRADFNSSLILAGWVLSIYQLVATAAMPLAGKAGDIFGTKRLFLLSVGMFTIGSLLCAIAPNIQLLIFARLLQALGGGGFLPIATGIVAEHFPESRQQAIGLFSSIFPIGQIIGPNIGGWLTDAFGWQSIFWFNVPLGLIILIAAFFILKSRPGEKGKLDLVGAGFFSGAITSLMIGLGELGNHTWEFSWVVAAALFVIAIVFIILFIRHESRVKEPFIDLQVLKEKPFLAANAFNFLFGVCIFGVMSFIPLYGVSIYNMTSLQTGLILTPRSIGMIVASSITSVFIKKWGYRKPMLIGIGVTLVALVLLSLEFHQINFGLHLDAMTWMIIVMLILGLGMGVAMPAANNACIELMPHRIATITGVRGMFRQTGGALSISLTTLLLNNFADIGVGFRVVFLGMVGILVIAVPLIFMMPSAPSAPVKASSLS